MTTEVERKIYTKKFNILLKAMKSELDRITEVIKNNKSESIKKADLIPLVGLLKYEIILKMNKEYEKSE